MNFYVRHTHTTSSTMTDASPNFLFGFNALMHVFILTTFLVIFYKLVVTKLETSAIDSQLTHALNKSLPDMFVQLDTASDNTLKPILQTLKTNGTLGNLQTLYAMPDPATTSYNSWLFTSAFIVIGALFMLVMTVILLTWLFDVNINLAAVLRENTALFIAIGVVELVFFLKIALKYVPAPPSYLNQQVVDTIKSDL